MYVPVNDLNIKKKENYFKTSRYFYLITYTLCSIFLETGGRTAVGTLR